MARVYVETTIPSVFFETRSTQQARTWRALTREWWASAREAYDLATSDFVLDELRRGPTSKARACLKLMAEPLLLEIPDGIETVIGEYVRRRVMPADSLGDAAHLAIASMHGVDFIVTWNLRHLANANKAQHIRVVNQSLGLRVPVITTPLTLRPPE